MIADDSSSPRECELLIILATLMIKVFSISIGCDCSNCEKNLEALKVARDETFKLFPEEFH